MLLLQRSASDSMPLRWETPGGAVDDGDPSILHAVARELHEEAGLVAKSIDAVVRPEGRLFTISQGRRVCKFEFVVAVEREGEGEGGGGDGMVGWNVKLDPNEHQAYVWATEEECRNEKVRDGDGEVEIRFTTEEQKEIICEAFQLRKAWEARKI